MRRDARAPRRRLPADGRRQHEAGASTRRSGSPARSRVRAWSGWRSRRSPTTSPGTRACCATAGCRWPAARICTRSTSSRHDHGGRRDLPRARRVQRRRDDRVPQGRGAGRGAQPAGHLARRARPDRAPAGRGPEPQLHGGPRLRPGALHRAAAAIVDGAAVAPDVPGTGSRSTSRRSRRTGSEAPRNDRRRHDRHARRGHRLRPRHPRPRAGRARPGGDRVPPRAVPHRRPT